MNRAHARTGWVIGLAGCLVWVATGSRAIAQAIGQVASDADIPWWRVILALIIGVLLAAVAAAALKARMLGGPLNPRALLAGLIGPALPNRRLEAIETLRLGPNLDVHLFRRDDREIMVAATPNTIVLLDERAIASTEKPSE